MASGTINGTTGNKYIESAIDWSATPSTANNNSVVTASLWYRRNNTYSGTPTSGTGTFSLSIDGQSGSTTVSLTIPNSGAWVKALEITRTVPHNSDGSRSITISASGSIPVASLSATYCSGTAVLDTIPRQANITAANNFTDLDNPSFSFSNPGGFAMDVWLEPNPVGDHLCIRKNIPNTGSYTWSLTSAEREQLRSKCVGQSCTIRIGLYSYVGNTTYASYVDKTFTMKESDATKPTVSITATLNNSSLPSTFDGMYIQGKSRLNVSISAQGKYSASIVSHSAKIGGETYNSNSFLSNVLSQSGTVDVIGYAKDSRQFTGSAKTQVVVTSYSKPFVIPLGSETSIQCYRSDGNGIRVGNSTSVWIKAKRTYYSLSGKNQCALQWRRKLVTDAWDDGTHLWKDLIPKTNTTTTEYNALIPSETFDLRKSYSVQIRAVDDIGECDIKNFEIPTQDVALHLGKGGKNVSVGTYCDYSEDYTFYSDWKAIFDKGVYIGENKHPINDFVIEQKTEGIWTYEKWASGKAVCWGRKEYITEITATWGAWYVSTTFSENYPFEFVEAPSCHFCVDGGTACTIINDSGTSSTKSHTGNLFLARPTSSSAMVFVAFYVIGRWK